MNKELGFIIGGSLVEGLVMRLRPGTPLESIKTGKFLFISGEQYRFFSLITDLTLEVSAPEVLSFPPSDCSDMFQETIHRNYLYATATLKPMIMLDAKQEIKPVKTIPPHFAKVYEASTQDVALIFGNEQDVSKRYFSIGTPLDMTAPVCINLERLAERSSGIFGKTGTGKTFITRLILAGLIHAKKASHLIFDMHSEYGMQARQEGPGPAFVKGLKTLFPTQIVIFSLDPESTRRRGGAPDVEVFLSYQDISVEDILALQEELNLHATAFEAAHLIFARYKQNWLQILLEQEDLKEFAQTIGAHPESLAALYRKLKRIERLPFFRKNNSFYARKDHNEFLDKTNSIKDSSVIDSMMEYLNKGMHVCVEFGNHTSTFCYLLISNIITRRIHTEYVEKTEKFLGTQKSEDEPRQLLITIEEAHKFLNPSSAKQTIFGTIAREMRKYYVSLLIVDQRPSEIDADVLSQIGTKIIAQLSDEKDIQAVLTGTNNAQTLRSVLASLDSKKQALVFGHAITMPVVVQTREYDHDFYRSMSIVSQTNIQQDIKELF